MTLESFRQAETLVQRIDALESDIKRWESARAHGLCTRAGSKVVELDKSLQTGFANELIEQAIANLTHQRDIAMDQLSAL